MTQGYNPAEAWRKMRHFAATAVRVMALCTLAPASVGSGNFGRAPRSADLGTTISDPHGNLELIAPQRSITPGRRFWVGLHFKLEKQWHIYWTNPGDSGEPPKVEWRLPAGFRAGPLQWPVPTLLRNQSIVDYGYEGEVLLPVPIYPPAHLASGPANLRASVRWLVCREVCIPARADLTLSLPVKRQASPPDPRWHELFQKTRAQLPRPSPPNLKAAAILEGDHFLLTIKTGSREGKVAFFPLVPMQIENSAPQRVTSLSGGVLLNLRKSEQLSKPVTSLQGVVILGPRRAFMIDAPVSAAETKSSGNSAERR
jgi:DsbC/DsbD-like thiol-disulfide interchange protein